ncbi:MAG TPA: NUDIX domain-containing protein [Gaiellaceae bacterium]|nr:NUDIX domain-containing protein [Gaiellaceae bacterium]
MRREALVHVRRGEEFLCVHRTAAKGGYWHTVAGGVERGEDWPQAARRELREETGLDAAVEPIGGFAYVREAWEAEPGTRVVVEAFLAEASAGWEPVLNEEHDEYRWLPREEAAELLFWPEPAALLRGLP